MEDIITFFNDTPLWFRLTILVGGVLLFWIIEGIVPLSKSPYRKFRHAGLNMFFTATTAIINLGFAGLLVGTAYYVSQNELGLIYLFEAPLWIKTIIVIMFLDFFGAWLVHWLEHKIKWMWVFHLIHHSDTHVDVTTGLRHHPGESIFRMTFTIMATAIIGAPIWMVILYQSLSGAFAHFTHANIRFPARLDKVLSLVFVTPNMHKVHHHFEQPYTDSNYGNLFSLWDRLFGNYLYADPETLRYGIDTHMDPKENERLINLLQMPFQKYRPPVVKVAPNEKS